jgi:SAM-dependent methyltransferase
MSIQYLSTPLPVHMGETWFEIATLDHFWIRRRFEVFQKLWGRRDWSGRIGEIGCGHGLVLEQMKQAYGVTVDGFDLNEEALKLIDPGAGRLFYYNIHDHATELKQAYDTIILFDVIEHLEDDRAFVDSVRFHLKPGGRMIVNVPANQSLYSRYDKVLGHQRRYDIAMMRGVAEGCGLEIEAWTYWGFTYLPLLVLRQRTQANMSDDEVTRRGFKPPGGLANSALHVLGRVEIIPNHWAGASLMAILKQPA